LESYCLDTETDTYNKLIALPGPLKEHRTVLWYFAALRELRQIQRSMPLTTFKVLHGMASQYLGLFVHVVDLPSWQALWSANTSHMVALTFKYSVVGGRTFSDSVLWIWTELPEDIAMTPSLPIFQRRHTSSRNHILVF